MEEYFHKNKAVKIKTIQPFLDAKLNDEEHNMLLDAEELDNQYNELKAEMVQEELNEFKRLDKEFIFNNYERHFNVSRSKLYAALVGLSKANDEIVRYTRKVNKSIEGINRLKIYYTLEGN